MTTDDIDELMQPIPMSEAVKIRVGMLLWAAPALLEWSEDDAVAAFRRWHRALITDIITERTGREDPEEARAKIRILEPDAP